MRILCTECRGIRWWPRVYPIAPLFGYPDAPCPNRFHPIRSYLRRRLR